MLAAPLHQDEMAHEAERRRNAERKADERRDEADLDARHEAVDDRLLRQHR